MALDIKMENILSINSMGENETSVVVENDIIIPDNKPDITKILYVDMFAKIPLAQMTKGKIITEGEIAVKIIYLSEEDGGIIQSTESEIKYLCDMDIKNAQQDMKYSIKSKVVHAEYEIINSRRISINAIVKVEGEALNFEEKNIVCDIKEAEDIEILKTQNMYYSYKGTEKENITVTEKLEIPDSTPNIFEIIHCDVKVEPATVNTTAGKIILNGKIIMSTLYTSNDNDEGIESIQHEIPYSNIMDMSIVQEKSKVLNNTKIISVKTYPEQDKDGQMRIINTEIVLEADITIYEHSEAIIINDIYGTKSDILLKKQEMTMLVRVEEMHEIVNTSSIITIGGEESGIYQIFNMIAKPGEINVNKQNDKILIEGEIETSVIYLPEARDVKAASAKGKMNYSCEIPYENLKIPYECAIDVCIENSSYNVISSNEVEVRASIKITELIRKSIKAEVVTDIEEKPFDKQRIMNQPSMVIYFVQNNDSLFSIAKRYSALKKDILKANNLDGEELFPGQQLIIPKKAI